MEIAWPRGFQTVLPRISRTLRTFVLKLRLSLKVTNLVQSTPLIEDKHISILGLLGQSTTSHGWLLRNLLSHSSRAWSKMSALSEGARGRSVPGLSLGFGGALICGSTAPTVEAMASSACVCLCPHSPSKDTTQMD